LWISVLLMASLYGCSGVNGNQTAVPGLSLAGTTLTPFLPANETTVPPADTHTPFPSETPTPAPTNTPTPSMRVNLEAVGDIMLARLVGEQVLAQGPEIVFAGVQSELDSADVLVGNLECALTSNGIAQPKRYTFAAPPETTQSLSLAGFDVLSLANNHAMDFGYPGLMETQNNLDQYGIASMGAGANEIEAHTPVIIERNGLRMAFLAYMDVPTENAGFNARTWIATAQNPGVAWADPGQITSDVAAARLLSDVVVVLLHSGYENTTTVAIGQREQAHAAIDAGASLVVGSHSHILQAVELYHGGLIAYSLGNFVFDDYEGIYNATIILHVVLTPAGLESYNWLPVLIFNGLPRLAEIQEAPGIGTMVAPLNP
jgi:poly-gamma-glutamate capsule biosynthesis protein CapA/YwtB (metallophosphatase superfamily)